VTRPTCSPRWRQVGSRKPRFFSKHSHRIADAYGVNARMNAPDSSIARRLLLGVAVLGASDEGEGDEAEADGGDRTAESERNAQAGEIAGDRLRTSQPASDQGRQRFRRRALLQPEDNSITLPYEFPAAVFGVITQSNPKGTPTEWGEAAGAVNSFIFAHEFAHALIHNFELPVLGREEDAADGIATVMLLKAQEGALYAIDAAEFWAAFSGRQDPRPWPNTPTTTRSTGCAPTTSSASSPAPTKAASPAALVNGSCWCRASNRS
jgi:hypothetical protein